MKKLTIRSICIVCALFMMSCTMTAFAGTGTVISIGEVVAADGTGEVEVPIVISGNKGIAGLEFVLEYSEGITLTAADRGDALSTLDFSHSKNLAVSPVKFGWDGLDADSTSGTIAVLTFTVPDDITAYSVSIGTDSVVIYDQDMEDIEYSVENGYISVDTASPDTDNDGRVTGSDIVILQQAIAGIDVSEHSPFAADFDDNGKLEISDLNRFMIFIRNIIEALAK